jgi:hypothetical protein
VTDLALFNAGAPRSITCHPLAPAAAIHSTTANAVPAVDDWQNVSGAHGPIGITLRRWTRTWWPIPDDVTVDFTVVVRFEYGARYRGGGLFIPNLYVEVPDCRVGWRYDVDVDIAVGTPDNANTDDAPIARVPVAIRGVVFNDYWSDSVDWSLTLWGDGSWMRT